jgi:hypothetical protein
MTAAAKRNRMVRTGVWVEDITTPNLHQHGATNIEDDPPGWMDRSNRTQATSQAIGQVAGGNLAVDAVQLREDEMILGNRLILDSIPLPRWFTNLHSVTNLRRPRNAQATSIPSSSLVYTKKPRHNVLRTHTQQQYHAACYSANVITKHTTSTIAE